MITYGIFVIILAVFFSALNWYFDQHKDAFKWWRKHLKKRKKVFWWFSIIAILFLWAMLEEAFSENILKILWAIHVLVFLGFVLWSGYQIYFDYKRVQRAISRRK